MRSRPVLLKIQQIISRSSNDFHIFRRHQFSVFLLKFLYDLCSVYGFFAVSIRQMDFCLKYHITFFRIVDHIAGCLTDPTVCFQYFFCFFQVEISSSVRTVSQYGTGGVSMKSIEPSGKIRAITPVCKLRLDRMVMVLRLRN